MAQQTINLGTAPNDGTGDDLRSGGDKINANFTELYAQDGVLAGDIANVQTDVTELQTDVTALYSSTTTLAGKVVYDVCFPIEDKPSNAETVGRFLAPRAFTIPAGATGSIAKAETAATGSTVFSLKKGGVEFGTVTFAAAGTTGTFAVASQVNVVANDFITVDGPATADATLADIGITLVGTR